MKRKVLSLLFAGMMIVSLAGCGGKTEQADSSAAKADTAASSGETQQAENDDAEEKTLTVAASRDTGELNPHTYSSPMWVQSLVYEGMTRFVDGKVVGGIAESWDISDDGKTYTFYLDKDNVFSDGTPVTAEIVKKNFDAVIAVKERHDWMETYQVLDSVDVVDEYTVQLNLNAPFSGLLQELALSRPVRIGAEAMFPDSGDTLNDPIKEPIGSGPWKIVEHVDSQYSIFERNDNYHGTLPSYKYLKVMIIPDINTAANALKAGEIDMIYDLDSQMTGDIYNELEASGFTASISDPVTTNMILVNTASGATKDDDVRLALEYGINKESISKNIYGGLQPVADYLMNPKTPYCDDPDIVTYTYDPEKAAEILDEAGWVLADGASVRSKDGEDLVLRFLYEGDNESVKTMGQAIQAEYAKIGVQVDMIAQDSTNYGTAQKEGAFELLQAETWGDPFDPHSYMSSFRVTTHGDYAAQLGLENKKEIDDKITEALNSTDEKVVEDNYQYVLETLTEQAVYIPVTYTTKAIIYNPDKVDQVSYNTTLDVLYETFTVK
ncbi:MAG: nickel ABC transporter substrate-binding protein [Lachnospiraceae bacterium]|nr:nickel ABC transporter substrate-binding protein [Lachnospiraceae bacterium]